MKVLAATERGPIYHMNFRANWIWRDVQESRCASPPTDINERKRTPDNRCASRAYIPVAWFAIGL